MSPLPLDGELQELDAQVRRLGSLVDGALGALQAGDQDKAGTVVVSDTQIDDLHLAIEERAFHTLALRQPLSGHALRHDVMAMLEGNRAIVSLLFDLHVVQRATCLLWIAHALERAADHCTNVCERIVFLVQGDTDMSPSLEEP